MRTQNVPFVATKLRASSAATAVLALLVSSSLAAAGLFDVFESYDVRDARSRARKLVGLCEASAAGQQLRDACFGVRIRNGLLRDRERQALVMPLLAVLNDTCRYDDGVHFEVIALLGRLRRPEVIPTLRTCLQREGRPLTKFQSGAALTRLGQARAGLPAVEEWARRGFRIDTLGTPGSPTQEFLYPLLRLPDAAEDSALNQYFVRVLSYPSQTQRIHAIEFLLRKDATGKEAAFDAAVDILAHPQPDKGGRFIERDRGAVLCILQKHGGARGKFLAAAQGVR
jgi:hypothetical protein